MSSVNDNLMTTLICPKCGGPAWKARYPIFAVFPDIRSVSHVYAECRSIGCQHLWKLPAESDAPSP